MIRTASQIILHFFAFRTRLMVQRARDAQQRRCWDLAAERWQMVIDRSPCDTGAWVQLGNMLNELGRRAEAINAFRHAGALDPALAHAPAGVAGVHERAGRWVEAGNAWLEAIELMLRDHRYGRAKEELTHALTHAAMAARNSNEPDARRDILRRTMSKVSDIGLDSIDLATRAQLLPPGSSTATAAFLCDFLDLLPPSAEREKAKALPAVRNGDLFHALAAIAPLLAPGNTDPDFLQIALDMYEGMRLSRQTVQLAEWRAALEPGDPSHLTRAFNAAAQGRQVSDARRLARRHARLTGDLILVHSLAELYEQAGRPARARLLFRFLRRHWPHSAWHARKYILTTAATRSLPLADRLVREELAAGRHGFELDQVYCQSAFAAGHYDEARLRLIHHTQQHDDRDADALLGYAIANSLGLDQAAVHFRETAARHKQLLSAMVGTAHMAMRKRDLPLALACWGAVAVVHAGAANAHVEQARCAYDMGDITGALRICETRLQRHGSDLGTLEFYAWLLTMNGQYREALPIIAAVLAESGPNWQAVDLQILCSSQLGTLDQDWTAICAIMPTSDSDEALSRFYHVIRILSAVGRRDLVNRTLLSASAPIAVLPWAAPYLRASPTKVTDIRIAAAQARWSRTAAMVRRDFSDRLDAMSDLAVDALLDRGAGELPVVHVVNKFEQPRGGSELHALDLARQIGRYADTRIWAPEMPHPEFSTRHRVSHIDPARGVFPRGGVLVLIGIYFDIARWIHLVRPARVVVLYNTFEAPALFDRIEEVWRHTGVQPELLYCADLMGRETGLPGRFEPSPTDLHQFSPSPTPRPAGGPFILGRHSRDVPEKHGRDDWKVYSEISALGGESRLLGGTCMAGAFPATPRLHLLKARSTDIPDFLHMLDAYFYRTSTWIEPWGRVVIEAMACGLPILVHAVGGYAQAVEHEVNGLLFDTTEEAVRLVRRLVKEPDLRLRLGEEARRSVCALLSPAALKRIIGFYLMADRPAKAD